ncbi:chemotaxis protein CheB [Parvularcula lutaonensis]|uniref:Chemotaxis protein CheB n=1 Tax=Parvularcula lutaonensis TaxID=491923 RepID=A0ABV7M8Q6_9PROT|nr:chemotaxis protein CheB [Parvularcula lutaonensis]GGY45462.1 chemotaxis protein CheR [Parvularcula lutaonensis]
MSSRELAQGKIGGPAPSRQRVEGRSPIVGVGASAGGLEAYERLLSGASREDGLSYVVVQHLDPHHESLLAELLRRKTDLDVATIEGGEQVEPNVVYLIPPNAELTIEGRELKLAEFSEPRGRRRPIDKFFKSLADQQGANAACIVLSGTGADGSEGLRAIKAAGGLTVAQDPSGARYAGMPSSAMTTGLVDLVLSPEDIPRTVASYFANGSIPEPTELSDPKTLLETAVDAIRRQVGHDFSQYKKASLLRRLARRMQILNISSDKEYAARLAADPQEAEQLFSDILINVTAFFRDPEVFQYLRTEIIPKIFDRKSPGERIRVWVPGCSSGEEAYSIAILLLEEQRKRNIGVTVEVFASDIDPMMTRFSREGVYQQSALAEVPPELVDRYFVREDQGYRVTRILRDVVRVSAHNVIKDPPFSKLDLISCRNLLIYFENALQRRLVPLFHYSLRKDGFLLLGPSENVSSDKRLFKAVSTEYKVYQRSNVQTPRVQLPSLGKAYAGAAVIAERTSSPKAEQVDEDFLRDIILTRYSAPFVVVDNRGEILKASRDTSRFLEFPVGNPDLNVTKLARRGLRVVVTALLEELANTGTSRKKIRGVTIEQDSGDDDRMIDVVAERLDKDAVLLVFLEYKTREQERDDAADLVDDVAVFDHHIHALEQELSQTEQDLRTTVEELETSNEELKSSNEEMMSMNEELQSANEELTTVNDELQDKVNELAKANADKANYLESTDIGIIFLDADRRVREFTPAATQVFKLLPQDIGRGLDSIRSSLPVDMIDDMLAKVEASGIAEEREFTNLEGDAAYLVRVLPYILPSGDRNGFVLTLTDISEINRVTRRLEQAQADYKRQLDEIREIYRAAPQAMALLDLDKRYIRANERLAEIDGVSVDDHLGRTPDDIVPGIASFIAEPIDRVIETGEPILGAEVAGRTKAFPDEDRIFEVDWYPVKEDGNVVSVGLCVRDITDQREMETVLRRVMRELQHRVKNILANVQALVNQSVRSDAAPDEKLAILSARIKSLAKTHDILTSRDWKSTPLSAVLEAELVDVYGADRVSLSGPHVELGSRATLAIAMALHELATNALKYGALSTDEGRLDISWWVFDRGQGATLQLEWRESGGPKAGEPERRGFGTSLINISVQKTLGGEIDRRFTDQGLECILRIPTEKLYHESEAELSANGRVPDPFSRG